MGRVSSGVQNFRAATTELAREAEQESRNITKRELVGALAKMVATDTLSAADRAEAENLLQKDLPLTRGAKSLVNGIASNDPGAIIDVMKAAIRVASAEPASGARGKAAALIEQFEKVNDRQRAGEYSVRFLRKDANSLFPSRSELTPQEALMDLMNGNEVQVTPVEYAEVAGTGSKHTNTPPDVARRKVRGAQEILVSSASDLLEWWDWQHGELTGDYGARGTPARYRASSHNGKRWG